MNAPVSRMIELVHVQRDFRRADGQRVQAVDDVSFIIPEGAVRLPGRTLGLRQEHAAADARGPHGAHFRRHRGRRQGDRRPRPRARRRLPEGQRLSLDARDRQCRIWPEMPRRRRRPSGARSRAPISSTSASPHVERAWPRELSGGMLKRVAIATVFANGGRGADARRAVRRARLRHAPPVAGRAARSLEAPTSRAVRKTVLFVTHDVDEALALADRIMVFRSGASGRRHPRGDRAPAQTPTALLVPDMVAIKRKLLPISGSTHACAETAA